MLDEKDLQAIAQLISDSEKRTAEKISELEKRTAEKISELEKRTAEKINESEKHMMTLMEAYFDPKFNLLAEGQSLIQEKMLSKEAIEDVEDRIDVLEAVVRRHSKEIQKLKKAQ